MLSDPRSFYHSSIFHPSHCYQLSPLGYSLFICSLFDVISSFVSTLCTHIFPPLTTTYIHIAFHSMSPGTYSHNRLPRGYRISISTPHIHYSHPTLSFSFQSDHYAQAIHSYLSYQAIAFTLLTQRHVSITLPVVHPSFLLRTTVFVIFVCFFLSHPRFCCLLPASTSSCSTFSTSLSVSNINGRLSVLSIPVLL